MTAEEAEKMLAAYDSEIEKRDFEYNKHRPSNTKGLAAHKRAMKLRAQILKALSR